MPANKENIKLLVEALRSGKYQKAKGKLRVRDCFCVKGVACELYRLNTGIGKWEGSDFIIRDNKYTWDDDIDWPNDVAKWYGLKRNCKVKLSDFGDEEFEQQIEYLNDDLNLSFNEIANIIESNFLLKDNNNVN